ncbi:hypothetical protein PtB15_8B204 [Puccinia triticina]|nr:hypothetical protein PtB15_8B204 [Puccinia triticina]
MAKKRALKASTKTNSKRVKITGGDDIGSSKQEESLEYSNKSGSSDGSDGDDDDEVNDNDSDKGDSIKGKIVKVSNAGVTVSVKSSLSVQIWKASKKLSVIEISVTIV